MAAGERVVIGRLAPVINWVLFLGLTWLVALLLWMAFVRGYHHPRYEGVRYGVAYFLPLLIPLGWFVSFYALRVFALVFDGGAALYVRDGRLFQIFDLPKGLPVEEIARVAVGPEKAFIGIAGSLYVEAKDGRQFAFDALLYRDTAEAMAVALKAELKRQAHDVGPITHINDADAPVEGG